MKRLAFVLLLFCAGCVTHKAIKTVELEGPQPPESTNAPCTNCFPEAIAYPVTNWFQLQGGLGISRMVRITNASLYTVTLTAINTATNRMYSFREKDTLNQASCNTVSTVIGGAGETSTTFSVTNSTGFFDVVQLPGFLIWPPQTYSGSYSNSPCPGAYVERWRFALGAENGWGWHPTNNPATITDFTRTDTHIIWTSDYGPEGCGGNVTTLPYPFSPYGTRVILGLYFPNNPPTTNYPLWLQGFREP